MDKELKEMQHAQLTANRVLHMGSAVTDHLENMRKFADSIGKRAMLDEKIEYLRTYGSGREEEFQTHLYTDIPFRVDEWNLVAIVKRFSQVTQRFEDWLTIGLIYHHRYQEWDLHS